MNQEQSKKINLHLHIGGIHFPLVIAQEDESVLKQAAFMVDQEINNRRNKNTIIKPLDVTAIMVALSTASKLLVLESKMHDNIQVQLKPHLDSLQDELQRISLYADSVMQQLEIS